MSFEDMQIEVARLEDELVRRDAHFLATKQAGDRLNGELRDQLEVIKNELFSLQAHTATAMAPSLGLQGPTNLAEKVQKHAVSLRFQKRYLQLSCRSYMVLLSKLTSKTYQFPALTAVQKFKRAAHAIMFIHRLKKAAARCHSFPQYPTFSHRMLYALPPDLQTLLAHIKGHILD